MQDQRTSDIRLCQAFSPVKPELSGACRRFFWRALEPPAGVRERAPARLVSTPFPARGMNGSPFSSCFITRSMNSTGPMVASRFVSFPQKFHEGLKLSANMDKLYLIRSAWGTGYGYFCNEHQPIHE